LMGVLSVVDKLILSLYTKSLSADITEILPLSHPFFLWIMMPPCLHIRRNGRSMSRTIFIECNRSFPMLSRSRVVDRKPAIAFEHAWFDSTTKEVY
jgi:hypothetical protein